MRSTTSHRRPHPARHYRLLLVAVSCFLAHDAPARTPEPARVGLDTPLAAAPRAERAASWSLGLGALQVVHMATKAEAEVRLYDAAGNIDDEARAAFERVASREPDPHALALRLEQLVFKAAYHFGVARVVVVSGWRAHAGRHGTGEALDFKLPGIAPREIAAYLRRLPRVGVGLYTHPGTQWVHVDVREPSYHWVDPSPPGVHWKERQLPDPHGEQRDATYDPEVDLPI